MPLMAKQGLLACIGYHATSVYLLVLDDMKTIMLPCTVFSIITAPSLNCRRIPLVVGWIFLHLLLCDVSNQSASSLEDRVNKPYRPIAAGRISEANAKRLLVALYCVSLLASLYLNTFVASLSLGILAYGYNALRMSDHWLAKNVFNAGAYACFEFGGTYLAGGTIDRVVILALLISFSVIATTIQCQDFQDEEGDRLSGRMTLPVQFGQNASRASFLVAAVAWSLIVPHLWHLATVPRFAYFIAGVYMGFRMYFFRDVASDKLTYKIYNVWLAAIHTSVIWARASI